MFIVGAPTIIAPLMGVDIDGFCTTTDNDDTCTDNALFSSEDVTELIGMAPNGIRIGGAVIVVVSFGIKGIQYRFVPQKTQTVPAIEHPQLFGGVFGRNPLIFVFFLQDLMSVSYLRVS